jgi:hypothetical protein
MFTLFSGKTPGGRQDGPIRDPIPNPAIEPIVRLLDFQDTSLSASNAKSLARTVALANANTHL